MNFEKKLSSQNNSKIYKYIQSLTSTLSLPSTISFDSLSASSDTEKANLFNYFFHSVFTQSSLSMPSPDQLPLPSATETLSNTSISEDDVYTTLFSLDTTKSMGVDGIGPIIFKNCAVGLYKPLHHLFMLSISQCYVPLEWRMHLISPIFKSGDRSSVRNYRPISLLCTISKVLEKIIYNKIISFVSKSISPSQFGFRPKHSTVQQLLLFTNNLYESFSAKAHSDVIYLDFKKAFDSVAHAELMMKLWTFGITGNLWRWFRAYLSARLQRVSINRCTSDLLPVLSGVPQGSILGPILFLIFVNDIPNTIENSQLYMFADDTKCHRSVSSTSDCYSLQNDLQQLSKWSQYWSMFFNDNKCVLLRFSPKPTHSTFHYTINNSPISIQEHHRDLGVIMSNNFTWNAHYIFISAQAYKILGLIRRSFCTGHHPRTKKILYLSLVRSNLFIALRFGDLTF